MSATATATVDVAPPAPAPPSDPRPSAERIHALIRQIESLPDAASRELMQDCLSSLLEFYGMGLGKILACLDGESHSKLRSTLAEDDLVRSMLLIHGLHPVPLEERLAVALASVRPYLESHGGNIELAGITRGVATLRLEGHCKTCPSSTATLELAVRRAIEEACPDLDGLEVEGMAQASEPRFTLPAGAPAWHILGSETELGDAALQSRQVNGARVVLCKVGELRYAYRDYCPICEAQLGTGSLDGALLNCPAGHLFDVRRAGRSTDRSDFHLEPFPLIVAGGMVKVAVC